MCFFFQAEDGIRDYKVTGVQTCALPISGRTKRTREFSRRGRHTSPVFTPRQRSRRGGGSGFPCRGPWGTRLIGRGSCRGRGEISVGAVSFKKKKTHKN